MLFIISFFVKMVGFEPTTIPLEAGSSNPLSYIFVCIEPIEGLEPTTY